ncbi:MAG: GNAT family N-acetyltransferase [Bacteroidota bacterium]
MKTTTKVLTAAHRKEAFDCGTPTLNQYLQQLAGQDMKRKLSVCFVLPDSNSEGIMGYYTLSNNGIPLDVLPPERRKKLPSSYTNIPVTLLGRLAVDKRFQGRGLGKWLLMDALKRSLDVSLSIASYAVIVDPLDPVAEMFYAKYGFIKLPDSGRMFLSMKTIGEVFG